MAASRTVAIHTSKARGHLPLGLDEVGMTKLLDPLLVLPLRWANRHESSFLGADFEALKKEIASAGGNVQPIKVRPTSDGQYQIVFGHRRQRACRELGLPVLAAIVSIDDRELWEEMERENRNRADLTPYEQGCHYRQALNEGLYPSIRKMAMSIGVDVSQAAKVIRLADLPREVIAAFPTPGAIQVNWATALGERHGQAGQADHARCEQGWQYQAHSQAGARSSHPSRGCGTVPSTPRGNPDR
jgi:ParB family chromosome partitioning protein